MQSNIAEFQRALIASLGGKQRTPPNSGERIAHGFLGNGGVIARLSTKPPTIAESEVTAKAQVGV